MSNYGIYDNSLDFYNNLLLNHRVKYNISSESSVLGTVIGHKALGVKAIVILGDDKKKYIIFPRNHSSLEIGN